jgi:hypothetical protein
MNKEEFVDKIIEDLKYYIPQHISEDIIINKSDVFLDLYAITYNAIDISKTDSLKENNSEGLRSIIFDGKKVKSIKPSNLFIDINIYKWLELIWTATNTVIAFNTLGLAAALGLILVLRDFLSLLELKIDKVQAELLIIICYHTQGKKDGISISKLQKSFNAKKHKNYSQKRIKELIEPLIQIKTISYNESQTKVFLNESVRFKNES